jgi:hypothetical protein
MEAIVGFRNFGYQRSADGDALISVASRVFKSTS